MLSEKFPGNASVGPAVCSTEKKNSSVDIKSISGINSM
jgi:hypothetical protein